MDLNNRKLEIKLKITLGNGNDLISGENVGPLNDILQHHVLLEAHRHGARSDLRESRCLGLKLKEGHRTEAIRHFVSRNINNAKGSDSSALTPIDELSKPSIAATKFAKHYLKASYFQIELDRLVRSLIEIINPKHLSHWTRVSVAVFSAPNCLRKSIRQISPRLERIRNLLHDTVLISYGDADHDFRVTALLNTHCAWLR